MKASDLVYVSNIIRSSGIGTKIQREAIIQRVLDVVNDGRDPQQKLDFCQNHPTPKYEDLP